MASKEGTSFPKTLVSFPSTNVKLLILADLVEDHQVVDAAGNGPTILSKQCRNDRGTSCYHFATELGSTARYRRGRNKTAMPQNLGNEGLPVMEQNQQGWPEANFKTGALNRSAIPPS
ncbi:hypothetical protein [Mesorhizobium sp. M1342]|uniref:hypothetical protein n=1 Tax=Mesorhizobium sp. M1342 TaxID=2957088 RepID=UPI00333D082A